MPVVYAIQLAAQLGQQLAGVFIPLLVVQYTSQPSAVGLVVAAFSAALFFSSTLFGRLADAYGRRVFIIVGVGVTALALFAHLLIRDLRSLYVVRVFAGLAFGLFPAAVMAYVYEGGKPVGRFTAVGSLGWGLGSVIAGLIASYAWNFIAAGAVMLAAFALTLRLRESGPRVAAPGRLFDFAILRRNWRVYFSFLLRHTGAAGIWAIYPIFLSGLGANKFWIGIVLAANTFMQFLFMPWLDRFDARRLNLWGLILSIVTFLSFAACNRFWQILPLQAVLALAWSCLYLGSVRQLMEENEERATAMGVFNSLLSLAGIIGPILGGVVGTLGYRWVTVFAALLTGAGLVLYRLETRRR